MKEQSYAKHTKYQPLQHFVWLPLSVMLLLGTLTYFIYSTMKSGFMVENLLLLGIVVLAIIPGMLARMYAIRLQDRLIRTEEQLRYFMLTNKRLDSRITMQQLIALRFAQDDQFVELAERTIAENLSPATIKREVQTWRADHFRV
ncbi:DUF6526 family protein [Sporosarcina sp. ITBMC105]